MDFCHGVFRVQVKTFESHKVIGGRIFIMVHGKLGLIEAFPRLVVAKPIIPVVRVAFNLKVFLAQIL